MFTDWAATLDRITDTTDTTIIATITSAANTVLREGIIDCRFSMVDHSKKCRCQRPGQSVGSGISKLQAVSRYRSLCFT